MGALADVVFERRPTGGTPVVPGDLQRESVRRPYEGAWPMTRNQCCLRKYQTIHSNHRTTDAPEPELGAGGSSEPGESLVVL